MAKHKLDLEVESILQHYGIKGMKWGIKRSEEEIQADVKAGVDAAGNALEDAGDEIFGNDSIIEELQDVIDTAFSTDGNMEKEWSEFTDAVKDKVEDVADSVKKTGQNILNRIMHGPDYNKIVIPVGKEKKVRIKKPKVPTKIGASKQKKRYDPTARAREEAKKKH